MTDLQETIISELIACAIAAVSSSGITEPAYCVVLAWSPGQQWSLPPVLGVGLASERADVLAAGGDDMKWLLWNPAEFLNYDSEELEVGSEALDAACNLLNEEMNRASSWTAAAEVLDAAAKALGQHEWGDALATTDDFIAYATDYELTDCTRSIRSCAPADRVASFEAKDWLI